ncbi:MAG: sigma-70 family RNA polymerase sigma factor [Lacunisphaera sp.]|nr:sigma-70 family RNA polymerase sigma factor [Lacunisphaera sp.]
MSAALVTAAGVARSLVGQAKAPAAQGRKASKAEDASTTAGTAAAGSAAVDLGPVICRVRAGDEDAARQLMDHLYPMVLSVVRGHLPRRVGEDDLTQMVFTKVFTKLDQFAGKVPLEHWVSRIAVNTCLNALQAEKIRPEFRWADLSEEEEHVVSSLVATSVELDPDQEVGARDLVGKLLDTLRPAERLLLTMLHMEGRSVAEIRESTGWNASLIKVRAFRARQRLKQQFKRLMQERAPTT